MLKPMSIESVMPSNHLFLCHPLFHLPLILSSIGVFSNESVLGMRWPKYWSFNFGISLSNEHSGLIRIDWFDLLAIQGILKSFLQHHSSKELILQHWAFFFTVQNPLDVVIYLIWKRYIIFVTVYLRWIR